MVGDDDKFVLLSFESFFVCFLCCFLAVEGMTEAKVPRTRLIGKKNRKLNSNRVKPL